MDGKPFEERRAALLAEWNTKVAELPGIMQGAVDVRGWQIYTYHHTCAQLEKDASKRLQWILERRGIKLNPAELLRSPLLRETLKYWHRDLQELSLHAFSVIESRVLREALLAKAGLPPPSFEYRKSDQILCPVSSCNSKRAFPFDGLVLHIHHKFTEFLCLCHGYNPNAREKYCELCPQSMKTYRFNGMWKHLAVKHKN
ncbi:hypothetical protein B0H17DRAFT_1198940 [Mycena rosella]|uniref:Uncharacterized protein n=1 Tax=Mycena rosella TaxID=1033263 RepID=A0AAD7DME5_MYCRO|nr:hypothetical protein B0H17DRAFT_1198940 [Mycena rosella]